MSLRSALSSFLRFRFDTAKQAGAIEETRLMVELFLDVVQAKKNAQVLEAQRAKGVQLAREVMDRRRGKIAAAVCQDIRYSEGRPTELQILLRGRRGFTFQELLGFYKEIYPWIGENAQEIHETERCMFTTITLSDCLVYVECIFRCGDLEQVFPTVTIWVGEEANVRVWLHEESPH